MDHNSYIAFVFQVVDDLVEGSQSPEQETHGNSGLTMQGIGPVSKLEDIKSSAVDDSQALQSLALQKHATKLKRENNVRRSEITRLNQELEMYKNRLKKLTSMLTPEVSRIEEIRQLKIEFDDRLTAELRQRDEEIATLKSTVTKMEKSMRSKHAEFEDRDFRLSLIENSNYDGTIIWKIPQFSQRMSDAQTGKYTSIFSLPFYTGRYGYKMCLRLYILGDGIGKNSHMSLFFVIMKGEFDNILQWPFTHKVTFKLINQTGGRDIIDTFQPDPMSSSFRKPKSDMNIASGCPRFVSHTELKSGGFIVEDTVFIKCSVDSVTIRHP